MTDVRCTGNETSLHLCNHNGWGNVNCRQGDVVGIVCSGRSIRLGEKLVTNH